MRLSTAILLAFAWMASVTVLADDAPPAEIEYLLTTMGQSECTFIRNGKEYDAADAEAHLRMKYRRGNRYASTTEDFIENLASKSSMSRKPYLISCDGEAPHEAGPWLFSKLSAYRRSSPTD
jgi:hypothetical protein